MCCIFCRDHLSNTVRHFWLECLKAANFYSPVQLSMLMAANASHPVCLFLATVAISKLLESQRRSDGDILVQYANKQ